MITPIQYNPNVFSCKPKNITAHKSSNVVAFCGGEFSNLSHIKGLFSSVFFRRGNSSFMQSADFIHVEDAVKLVYNNVKMPKILIVGVGKAQEPFSFLTVIKSLFPNKPLETVVDMHCVDIQPKISDELLPKYSYLDSDDPPMFAKDSFDVIGDTRSVHNLRYKVKSDIVEYLKKIFNDVSKTQWGVKIEDVSSKYPPNSFDIVSINNTLRYIDSHEDVTKTMNDISKTIKKEGILITDPLDIVYKDTFNCLNDYKNINPGIWQKVT